MISSLALFLFHRASIEARNKNLMRMGGMGPGFHFPVQLSGAHLPGILVSTAYRWSVASPGCGSQAQACGMRRPAGIRPSLLSRPGFISEERTITALHLVKNKNSKNNLFQLPLFRKILQIVPLTKLSDAVQLPIYGLGRLNMVGMSPGQGAFSRW